jgi:hypothetical protein
MDVQDFIALLNQKDNGNTYLGANSSSDMPNRLAVIDPAYIGVGFPHVTFEGESTLSGKPFAIAGTYVARASDRVVMIPVGTTYLILDSVQNNPLTSIVTAGPRSYYQPWVEVGGSIASGAPQFLNSWGNWDGGFTFAPARYMVDAKGKVRLSGLVTNSGSNTSPIFKLPSSLVPDYPLIFIAQCQTSGGSAEVRIDTSGNVNVSGYNTGNGTANSGYVSLDKVAFFPASRGIPWVQVPIPGFLNSWVNYGTVAGTAWAPARYFVDCDGFVHWSGLIKSGTVPNVAIDFTTLADVVQINPGLSGSTEEIFNVACSGGTARVDIASTSLIAEIFSTGGTNVYVSIENIDYPGYNAVCSWRTATALTYAGGWLPYGTPYAPMRYCKDSANIVRWSGLVKSGTGAMMAQVSTTHRPAHSLIFDCGASGYNGRMDITPLGLISTSYGTGGSNAFVNLADVRYFAEPIS